MEIAYVFGLNVFLFLVGFGVKKLIGNKLNFCVICFSVFGTWATFLGLYILGVFEEPIIIAIMMGESAVGIYYLLEKYLEKKNRDLEIFKFPFLISLTFLIYSGLSQNPDPNSFLLIIVTWLIMLLIYLFRTKPALKKIAKQISDCCKNW